MTGQNIYNLAQLAQFVPRRDLELHKSQHPDAKYYDASRDGPAPILSPFFGRAYIQIPVPGQKSLYSRSVEGIWQGLKIVNGTTCFEMFGKSKPWKRPSCRQRRINPVYRYLESRFLLGEEELGLVEARHKIYVPAYTFFYNNLVPRKFKETAADELMAGSEVFVHDVGSNGDIDNPERSYAHAALLVDLINKSRFSIEFNLDSVMENHTLDELLDELDCPEAPKESINLEYLNNNYSRAAAYAALVSKTLNEFLLRLGFTKQHTALNSLPTGGEQKTVYTAGEKEVSLNLVLREKNTSLQTGQNEPLVEKRQYLVLSEDTIELMPELRAFRDSLENSSTAQTSKLDSELIDRRNTH